MSGRVGGPPTAGRVALTVLGPLRAERDGTTLDLGGPRPRLLLALLVVADGVSVAFDRLLDDLYGDDPPPTARKSSQVHVSNLRRQLGPGDVVLTTPTGYRLQTSNLDIDAAIFEREVRDAAAVTATDPARAAAILVGALARWHGPAYSEFADHPALRPDIARLDELRLRAIELRIDADLRLGHHAEVLSELEALTRDHPFREELRAAQMLALYRAGRQADALRVFSRTRQLLIDELGIEPAERLRALECQILEQSAELQLADTSTTPPAERAIHGYELRGVIGIGATGVVHRAYHASVGREVAIKVIRAQFSNRPDFVKRFDADAQIVAMLDHPHLVPLIDHWRDPDGAYLVMPFLAGGSLADMFDRHAPSRPMILRLVDQVGGALAFAHRRGVVHGGLKPANVLLDADGNLFLTDFGVAAPSPVHGRPAPTRYLAPEQLAGAIADPRSDLYCFAVLVHEALTGSRTEPDAAPRPVREVRPDLPAELDGVFGRATERDPRLRYDRVEDFLRAVRRALGADVAAASDATSRAWSDDRSAASSDGRARNPFKGLRPFSEVDAGDYYGREALVHELVDSIRRRRFTCAVGPSGSGKSSVVKAGVLPAIRAGARGDDHDVVIAEMFPGSHPFEELEAALLRIAVDRPDDLLGELRDDDRGLLRVSKRILPDDDTHLLLVIDQFEELFSHVVDDEVRERFLGNLVSAARDERGRVSVLATLRADFFDRPLRYPEFGEILEHGLVTVAMPSDDSLARAISQPVRSVGLDLEPGLIPTIIGDVGGEPGALPLLQYAMTELVEQCTGRVLTIDAYLATGRATGALAGRAEDIFASLSPGLRSVARDLFLRLVTVSDDADDTRRRVRRSELATMAVEPAGLDAVIGEYGRFRLLSFDRDPVTRGPTVEVAHEALIREWPRYREWIDDRRDDLMLARRLETAAREWDDGGRDPSYLLTGGRLQQFRETVGTGELRTTGVEREYLAASEQLDREHERERVEHGRRDESLRRRSRLLLASAAAAVVMLLLAGSALVSRNRAQSERLRAEILAGEIDLNRQAQRLASEALAALDHDSELAVSLAIAAVRATEELGEVEHSALDALHWTLQGSGVTFPADDATPVAARPAPDATRMRGIFMLPVDELVTFAQDTTARPFGQAECRRYFPDGPCPDPTDPLDQELTPAGGTAAYIESTDAERPLAGTVVRIGHQTPPDVSARWGTELGDVMRRQGIDVTFGPVDLLSPSMPDRSVTDMVVVTDESWIRWAARRGRIIDMATFNDPTEAVHRFGELATGVLTLGQDRSPGVFAVPMSLTSSSHVMYRTDVFAANGYAVPTTWQDLIELSEHAVEDGLTPWCWAGQWTGVRENAVNYLPNATDPGVAAGGYPLSEWLELLVLRHAGPDALRAWAAGDVDFVDPSVRDAFERLGSLVFPEGFTFPSAAVVPRYESVQAFQDLARVDQRCLMILASTVWQRQPTDNPGYDPAEVILLPRSDVEPPGKFPDFAFSDLGLFPFPMISPEFGADLLVGGSQIALTVDSPENRAVLDAIGSSAFAEAYMVASPSFIPPDADLREAMLDSGAVSGLRATVMADLHAALAGGRAHRGASDGMPFEFTYGEYEVLPTSWFERGPGALDDLLLSLDVARNRASSYGAVGN